MVLTLGYGNFLPGEISDEQIQEMVRLAGMAPSGYNAQPWEFVFVRKPENIEHMQTLCYGQKHVMDTSAMCIVLGDLNIVSDTEQNIQEWKDSDHIDASKYESYTYCFHSRSKSYKNSYK